MELNKIVNADSIEGMKKLPANSVDCCVTSPPYYGLRDYLVKGQYGLEKSPEAFIKNMVAVFEEVRRVLKPSGTLWINIGDSYATSGSGTSPNSGLAKLADKWAPRKNKRNEGRDAAGEVPRGQGKGIPAGIKPKDLIGIPWMLAFALRSAGWYLRQDIIWHKSNPMPESVKDRCTKAHEYIFLFSKSKHYYYDAEAIKEPASESTHERVARAAIGQKSNPDHVTKNGIRPKKMGATGSGIKNNDSFHEAMNAMPDIRNKRSVWSINPQAFPEAHFATFPEKLPMECIRAGSSEHGCCAKCGHPYTRILKPSDRYAEILGTGYHDHELDQEIGMAQARGRNHQNKMRDAGIYNAEYITMGWQATCKCDIGLITPSVILDPFMGAGTTALVARKSGRNYIGFELNPAYIKIAENRLAKELGMFL